MARCTSKQDGLVLANLQYMGLFSERDKDAISKEFHHIIDRNTRETFVSESCQVQHIAKYYECLQTKKCSISYNDD